MLETINCQLDHPFGKEDKLADFLINQILDAAFLYRRKWGDLRTLISLCVLSPNIHIKNYYL